MHKTHPSHSLRPLVLAIACLAAGASWAQQVTVDVVVEPVPTVDPVVAARQQEMSLQLARANLSQQGISEPTTAQLALATSDVQAQRDSGMGWGQIANSLGLRLGAVVSAANRADKADKADRLAAATPTRPATAGSKAKGGNSGISNAGGGQGAGSSGNQGGGAGAGGGGNAGGNSGNGGKGGNSGNGGGNGGKGGGKR